MSKEINFLPEPWTLNEVGGWGEVWWGEFEQLSCEVRILLLSVSTLICVSWVFLESYYSHCHKAFFRKFFFLSQFEELSSLKLSFLVQWEEPVNAQRRRLWELEKGWESLCPCLFVLSIQNQDCPPLRFKANKPRSGMRASCASIYTSMYKIEIVLFKEWLPMFLYRVNSGIKRKKSGNTLLLF